MQTSLRTAFLHCISFILPFASFLTLPAHAASQPKPDLFYDLHYRAQFQPEAGTVHVELHLKGNHLPRKLVLKIDPKRQRAFTSTDPLETTAKSVTWQPQGKSARLAYDFVVNHERSSGAFDSLMTKDWALFRGDRMVPKVSVTAPRNLKSHATLEFVLPKGWSALTPYERESGEPRTFDDPKRRFDRPQGWMIVGKLGTRSEKIADIHTIIASPAGEDTRRQDTLAFLNWNLPLLAGIFQSFPSRLLIVSAGDPMWRGGLSAPASLFVHSHRPLISENRTSTLLHELVHVAMGIHGDHESDWIVEGFAEFYSIESLRRSGGISKDRYDDAMQKLGSWGSRAPTLFVKSSSGATTARAVIALHKADDEIRHATGGKGSLDDVARELAHRQGKVSLPLLQSIAEKVAGRRVQSLERAQLSAPPGSPAR
jgi:hypothetical protein